MRIFPEMCASTLWPFSSSTRNMAFGSGSTTVPSTRIASSLGLARGNHLRFLRFPRRERPAGRSSQTAQYKRQFGPRRSRYPSVLLGQGEDLGAMVGHGDRVLEVGGERPVPGDHRPAVVERLGLGLALVDHRLDGQDVALLDPHAPARLAVVGDGRLLVHGGAD